MSKLVVYLILYKWYLWNYDFFPFDSDSFPNTKTKGVKTTAVLAKIGPANERRSGIEFESKNIGHRYASV